VNFIQVSSVEKADFEKLACEANVEYQLEDSTPEGWSKSRK